MNGSHGILTVWPLTNEECYVSIDVETDGPIPGVHSMLSLGAAAFDAEGQLQDTWSANLEPLPEASEHPRTMRWWAAHADAWEAARANPQPPQTAIVAFVAWAEALRKTVGWPVAVAFPAAFDALWVEWYCVRFAGASPFRRRCVDLRTLVMVAMGAGYREAGKTSMPQHWRCGTGTHAHRAVDDATEQGRLFFRIVRELGVQRGDVALALEPRPGPHQVRGTSGASAERRAIAGADSGVRNHQSFRLDESRTTHVGAARAVRPPGAEATLRAQR